MNNTNSMNEYVVISIDRYENMKDEMARIQSEAYLFSKRVRELEHILLEAYKDSDTHFYAMVEKKQLCKILNIPVEEEKVDSLVVGGDPDND